MRKKMMERLTFLSKITCQGTLKISHTVVVSEQADFFNLVKSYAETFHKLINHANDVNRFLGNSSYRCQRGFPSFKVGDYIFVSRRNVDKRYISKENFVPTYLKDGRVYYVGHNIPSVDTLVQLRFYEKLENINYMIHAHVYLEDTVFTNTSLCGALEEVDEILEVIDKNCGRDKDYYAINMVGHGCIVMSSSVDKLKGLKYKARSFPEVIS